jgi:Flp pilus assembly pilin Flp
LDRLFVRFLRDDCGAALSEYALVAALLVIGMLGTLTLIGTEASSQLGSAQSNLTNASTMTASSLP